MRLLLSLFMLLLRLLLTLMLLSLFMLMLSLLLVVLLRLRHLAYVFGFESLANHIT
jgi:hypothetical protein